MLMIRNVKQIILNNINKLNLYIFHAHYNSLINTYYNKVEFIVHIKVGFETSYECSLSFCKIILFNQDFDIKPNYLIVKSKHKY
jgi:hypothetical protein